MRAPSFQQHVLRAVVGALLSFLGLLVLVATWLPGLHLARIAALLVPNAALGFCLLGLALLDLQPRLSALCASVAFAIGCATLMQYVLGVDLHIDQGIARVWLDMPALYPGRMAPQTAICFMLGAATLLLWHSPLAVRAASLAQVLALTLTALAVTSLIGYFFDLEGLYRWYGYSRMSPLAAALFVPAGAALWMMCYRHAIEAGRYDDREDERIRMIASSLLVLVAAVAGASGFILLAASSEQASRVALGQSLAGRIELLSLQLDERIREADRLTAQLQTSEGATLARRTALRSFVQGNIAAIRWESIDGDVIEAGERLRGTSQAVSIDAAMRLLWGEEAWVQIERRVGGTPGGRLRVEARLPLLTAMLGTGMLHVCTRHADQSQCLPENIAPPVVAARDAAGLNETIDLAFAGASGTLGLRDGQGRALLAAYGPASHGLAIVLRQDTDAVYAALRHSRLALTIVLVAVIAIGIFLLRSKLRPLARQAREARAAAVDSVARTEAIMNSVADGIVTIDDSGAIVAANRALYDMFGYTASGLLGLPLERLIPHGLVMAGERASQAQAGREARERSVEVIGRRYDGSTFAAQLALTPMQLGEARYLVGNIRDVTLAKFAEAQLRRANERFKLATQAARLGVFEWDITSGALIWDTLVHELHGLGPDVTPTYDIWRRLVHPDDLPRLEQQLDAAIAVDRTIAYEFRIVLPDCSERLLRTAATVARDQVGAPMRITGVTWDVTESRRLERMKSEFVSVVSHELRTPLTSIRGALGLIAGTATSLPERMQQLLDIAYRNTDRLALLISDILDIEKIESGGLAFTNELLNVRAFVEQAVENNQAYAAARGVRLQIVTSTADVQVMADANRLLQVMANLLSNAAKFSPAGAPVDIAVLPMTGFVRISVRDYGPGIPEAFQPRVFHKFAQADASDSRAKGGTGLGLAISKAIIERLGGRIGYDSAPGVGTLFYFDLPLATDITQSGIWRSRAAGTEA